MRLSASKNSIGPCTAWQAFVTTMPNSVLIRSKLGVELYEVPDRPTDPPIPAPTDPFILKGTTTLQESDGKSVFVHVDSKGIYKIDLATKKVPEDVFLESTAPVQMMHLSPSGTYLLTWERWYADRCENNMKVWDTVTGELLAGFPQKALSRDSWPYLYWTPDEEFAFLHATNEVRVFPASAFRNDEVRYTVKLRIEGISSLSLPQTPADCKSAYFFTSFCSSAKNKPAQASLHVYRPGAASSASAYPSIHSKSLFQVEDMKTHWSPKNDAALVVLGTSVDASGESYYGSSQLFLLASSSQELIAVPSSGPVFDAGWMPDPSKPPCFVVISGRIPPTSTLHHGSTGQPIFQFGQGHRNSVSWSPHGRFLCLAGFGNMAGGMGFWDRNKCKLMPHNPLNVSAQLKAEAVVGYGWSPDSRMFCVSTCTPRMNVDNSVRLFTYAGVECINLPWEADRYKPDKLLQATFVPGPLSDYPDRPMTPPPEGHEAEAATAAATAAAPKSAGRYVPPSQRKRGGGSGWADQFRKEKEGQGAGKVTAKSQVAAATGRSVVGLAPASTSQKSKSAQRREKVKLKKQQQEQQEKIIQQHSSSVPTEVSEAKTESVDPEKRAKKLKKILRQIEDLKTKDESSLNEDQRKKIASEAEILKELEGLQI